KREQMPVRQPVVRQPGRIEPLEEVWAFVLTQLENNERDNQKLRRAMRFAFEMGVINECQQITDHMDIEFHRLGWPDQELTTTVLNERAMRWMNLELGMNNKNLLPPPDTKRRRRWVPRVQLAFVSASLAVAQMVAAGRSAELVDTYKELYEK